MILGILTGVRWNLWVILIFIHSWLGLFGSLESNFLSSLLILDISPLSDVGLVQIFFQSVGCHFVLLTVSFVLEKLFNFMRSHLSIVDFRAWVISFLFRKFSPVPNVFEAFLLSLLLDSVYLVLCRDHWSLELELCTKG